MIFRAEGNRALQGAKQKRSLDAVLGTPRQIGLSVTKASLRVGEVIGATDKYRSFMAR